MNPVWLLTLAIFAPLLCGAASLMLPRHMLGPRVALAAAGPLSALLLLASYVNSYGLGAGVIATTWMPAVQMNLQYNPDHLGLFFAFLVSGIGLLIVLYARGYFGPDRDSLFRFYPTLLMFMTAMLGVALSDNFMLMLLFWEMTSISSFLLIGWERDDAHAVKLAMQAFVTTAAGGLAMMGGLILLGVHTGHIAGHAGCWSFSELRFYGVTGDATTTTAFLLIFAGAAAKSAQFPLHFWLPGAMAAPTPVSAYLHSATMVKAGVYLVGRMWPIMAMALPIWPKLIVPLGAVTMLYGRVYRDTENRPEKNLRVHHGQPVGLVDVHVRPGRVPVRRARRGRGARRRRDPREPDLGRDADPQPRALQSPIVHPRGRDRAYRVATDRRTQGVFPPWAHRADHDRGAAAGGVCAGGRAADGQLHRERSSSSTRSGTGTRRRTACGSSR